MRWILLLLVALLLGVGSYVALKPGEDAAKLQPGVSGQRLRVGATIYPLADWLREIAGPDADVHLFCAGVSNPHHFDPSPQDAMEVSRAHAIFSIGLGLDEWAHKLVNNSGRRNLPLHETGFWISARKLLKSEEIVPSVKPGAPVFTKKDGHDDHSGHSHEHHHHGDEDPHYWLDPERAAIVVKRMAEELAQLDAAHAAGYQQRAAAYIAKLDELKKKIDAEKRAQPQKLVTLHDAYGYLFDRMNIQIAAVVQVSPGVEPATRDFSEAVRAMKELGQKTIFTEPAGNPQVAKMLAADVSGTTALLDPMDIETSDAGKTYLERMAHNLRTLAATRDAPDAPNATDATHSADKTKP